MEARANIKSAELSLRKERIMMHTRELAKHILSRSNQTVAVVSSASSSVCAVFNKFKIFVQHLSSYPRITYLPMLFFACGAYGFNSVESSAQPTQPLQTFEEKPISDMVSLKRWLLEGLVSEVIEVVGSNEVKKEGLSYLERMFKNKQVHDALIVLLKGGVKDSRFVEDSKVFGKDWIS